MRSRILLKAARFTAADSFLSVYRPSHSRLLGVLRGRRGGSVSSSDRRFRKKHCDLNILDV